MDKKYAGEVALRESGIPYTIVRPGGLKNTPRGKQRLVVSQGDNQSVSTVSRSDVAAVCVACLEMASTKNVTFEVTTASPATSPVEGVDQQLAKVLSGLKPDDQCQ